MPRMPGFLQNRSKKEQAEWDLVQSRTAARLAAMFREETGHEPPGDQAPDAAVAMRDGVEGPAEAPVIASAPRERRRGGRRPGIVVMGDAGATEVRPPRRKARPVVQRGAGPNGWTVVDPGVREDPAAPVPVMVDRTDVAVDHDGWRLPTEPAPDLVVADSLAEVAEPVAPIAPIAPSGAEEARGPDMAAAAEAGTAEKTTVAEVADLIVSRAPARGRSRARNRVMAARAPVVIAHCPYCALVLDPAPTVSRRCERCRQRIVVKRVDGQTVYLTEAAVQVFDVERRRVAKSARLTRERERWLRLAASAGAPAARQAQLAAARLTEEVVATARSLYLTTVDRGFRSAKRERDWDGAARIRRDQAMALYRLAGSPVPPPADVLATYREGVAAELRGVAEISRDAELVSARCCDACRADDGRILRITSELRAPRLPHDGCPKGLCRCHWDLAARDRRTIRRYLQRRPNTALRKLPGTAAADPQSEAAPPA